MKATQSAYYSARAAALGWELVRRHAAWALRDENGQWVVRRTSTGAWIYPDLARVGKRLRQEEERRAAAAGCAP